MIRHTVIPVHFTPGWASAAVKNSHTVRPAPAPEPEYWHLPALIYVILSVVRRDGFEPPYPRELIYSQPQLSALPTTHKGDRRVLHPLRTGFTVQVLGYFGFSHHVKEFRTPSPSPVCMIQTTR